MSVKIHYSKTCERWNNLTMRMEAEQLRATAKITQKYTRLAMMLKEKKGEK